MALPNPGMNFTPLDPLSAAELNDVVENIEALQDWSAFENSSFPIDLIADGAVTPAKRTGGFATINIPGSTLGSTGNKIITGVGFAPKRVRFNGRFPSSGGTASTAVGGADKATGYQWWTATSATTSGGTSTSRNSSSSACIAFLPGSSATPAMEAELVSWDADGITINVLTASSAVSYTAEFEG